MLHSPRTSTILFVRWTLLLLAILLLSNVLLNAQISPPSSSPAQSLPVPSPRQQQFLQQFQQPIGPAFAQQATLTINGNVANAAINQLDPCRYFENVTDVQQLNRHEYVAFEQCLYYFLAHRAQAQSAGAFGAIHPIATLPPAYGSGSNKGQQKEIRVKIGQITLQHFQLNEFMKDLHIVGYLEVSWDDPRLTWDTAQWKFQKLQIHSAHHVWMPVLSSQAYETSLRNEDGMEVRKLEATNRGNVSAVISFSLKTFCDDADFRHFPDDIYKCCFMLEPHFNQELIEFAVDGLPVFTDPKYFRDYGWSVSGTIPTVNSDPSIIAQLNFCINLQRASSAVKIELWLPTWATALLFLFSPLFGSVKQQMALKLFILLLQTLTLQLYSNRIAPFQGSASATPVIMSVLELATILNVLSIVFSLVVWVLMRFRRTLPPWGWLSQSGRLVNRYLFVLNQPPRTADVALPHYCNANYDDDFDRFSMGGGGAGTNGGEKSGGCTVGMSNGVVTINPSSAASNGGGGAAAGEKSQYGPGSASSAASTASAPSSFNRYQFEWNQAFMALHALGVTALSLLFVIAYLFIR